MATYNPGAGFKLSSAYGTDRFDNERKVIYPHDGDDWEALQNTPIPAAADGEVAINGWEGGYGYYIALKHIDNKDKVVYTIYAQMAQKSTLRHGELVKKGDIVGYVGKTGNARGNHLHFETRIGEASSRNYRNHDDFYNRNTVNPSTYDLSQLKSLDNPAQSDSAGNTNQQANTTTTNSVDNVQDDTDVSSYVTPTACTEDQFIVQIMGKDHPQGQRVILLDDKNNEIEPDNKNDIIESSELSLLSTLHTWDWCNLEAKKDRLKAYLEIKTDDKPIRILISEQIKQTNKQTDKQFNQIVPVVPTTLVGRAADFNYESSYARFVTNMGVPVVTRSGFLYIFKGNILLREIQIIEKDKNTLAFKDVPIEQYRNLNFYKEGKREATGVELAEIWIPACWNETDVQNTSFMYSEVQLSAARLNVLAIDEATFTKHPKTTLNKLSVEKLTQTSFENKMAKGQELLRDFSFRNVNRSTTAPTQATSKSLETINIIKQNIVSANFIAPHRMRDVILETTLDNPSKYLYDQEETYFKNAIELAQKFEADNEKGKANFYNLRGNYYEVTREIRDLEFGAWSHQVETRKHNIQKMVGSIFSFPKSVLEGLPSMTTEEAASADSHAATLKIWQSIKSPINAIVKDIVDIVSNNGEPVPAQTPPDMWSNAPAFNNVLQDAQDREIYIVYIDDILFSNRHLSTNITNTAQQLRLVVDQAARQNYFDSALIIQQLVAPKMMGGQENELRKTLEKKLDQKGKEKLSIACSATGRAALVTKYSELQGKLCVQFKSPELLETLADHLSQDNEVHYTAAYINTLQSILSFALPTNQIDPYLSPDNVVYYGVQKIGESINPTQGLEFVATLVQTLDSQLHKILFKPVDLDLIGKPLQAQDKNKVTPNLGNGYIRPNLLHKCLHEKKEASDEDKNTLDAALLALAVTPDENQTLRNTVNFGKDVASIAARAHVSLQALVEHWENKQKTEINQNNLIRSDLTNIENERKRLQQQIESIEEARQKIATQESAPIINETITIAEETSKNTQQAIEANERYKAEIESKLPQIQEDANKARQIQELEQQQQQNQQKIATTAQELKALEQKQQAARQANQDQATIAENERQITGKRAELDALKRQTPNQTASNQGNAHINDALANNRNNGQARVGNVTLHELPIKLWRLVMFDHTRHVLGGLISEAYIAPFEQRIQGAGSNVKGVLIRFPGTPEAKTLLRELYGDMVNADYQVEASTSRNRTGRQNPVNTRSNFLAVFAPEGSELHQFVNALEQEALAGRAEEFANANTAKRVEIAEGYRNRARAELDSRQARQGALQGEITALEGMRQAHQTNVDNIKNQFGQLLDNNATEQQRQQKREQLATAEQNQRTNANNIEKLKADLGLERTYQDGLRTLIDTEQATINKLGAIDSANESMGQTKTEADQTAANERSRIETERKQQLLQAQDALDNKIAQHSAECERLQQQKPNYATLRENLTSSERAIAAARNAVSTNTTNLSRLDRLVDNHYFRGAVLAFQSYNLYVAFRDLEKTLNERGGLYTSGVIFSAVGNFALAVEDIIANATKQNMNAVSKVFRNKVLYDIPERFFPKFLSGSSKVVLTLKVTGIILAQTVLSVVAIGLTATDLWYSINEGDKGIIIAAKGLALLGSIAGLASIFIGGATFLLLNPLGWAALLLTLAAFALIWIFSKTPLEAWIQYGPFSASPEPYLINQTEAFYRLVGIYADLQITIENNPDISRLDPQNRQEIEIPYQHNGESKIIKFTKIKAGKRIRITSQLNGLMASGKDTIVYNSHFRLQPQGGNFLEEVSNRVHNSLTIIENNLPNGKEYLIDSVESVQDYKDNSFSRMYNCEWQVASQILVNYGGKPLAFPALRANNDEQYNHTQALQPSYNEANFNRDLFGETRQVFWANETSHLAEAGKTAAAPQTNETTVAAQNTLSVNASLAQ